jgi:hypothetical protein
MSDFSWFTSSLSRTVFSELTIRRVAMTTVEVEVEVGWVFLKCAGEREPEFETCDDEVGLVASV